MKPPCSRAAGMAGALLASCALAVPATAQLPLPLPTEPLPDAGQIVSDVGDQAAAALPTGGGLVSDATGTAGGLVSGVESQVTGTVDATLGDVLDAATGTLPTGAPTTGGLPASTLDSLLAALGLAPRGGLAGGGSSGGTTGSSSGTTVAVDGSPPKVTFTLLTRLRTVVRGQRLRVRVTTDEPGVVALRGDVRPGLKRRTARRKARRARGTARAAAYRHSRKAIKVPTAVLAFRRAGSLTVSIKLGTAARRTLNRSRNARLTLAYVAADALRNQASSKYVKNVPR